MAFHIVGRTVLYRYTSAEIVPENLISLYQPEYSNSRSRVVLTTVFHPSSLTREVFVRVVAFTFSFQFNTELIMEADLSLYVKSTPGISSNGTLIYLKYVVNVLPTKDRES